MALAGLRDAQLLVRTSFVFFVVLQLSPTHKESAHLLQLVYRHLFRQFSSSFHPLVVVVVKFFASKQLAFPVPINREGLPGNLLHHSVVEVEQTSS